MQGSDEVMLNRKPHKHSRRFIMRGAFVVGLVVSLVLSGCVSVPKEYREPVALVAQDRSVHNLEVFDKVWTLVNKNYFDPKFRGVDWAGKREKYRPEAAAAGDDESLYRVINKMAAELKESHLHALSPRRAHEMTTEHRAAIGINMHLIEGRRIVSYVLPGSPADLAGVKPGWIVVSRNGLPFPTPPAIDPFVARLGEPVRFAFLDEKDRSREFTFQPQLLKFEQLISRTLPDDVLYLRFDEFGRETLSWLSSQLKLHHTMPAVVIDLRQNHGGNALALTVTVAEFFGQDFLERGKSIGRWVQRDGHARDHRSLAWFSAHYAGRVFILTSPSTGSAAEIFAHVLQHYHRATVIGRKTAGAVIVSTRFSLPGGGLLQVPIRDYVGLDGQRLEGCGVVPDIEVPLTLKNLRLGNDAELAAALSELEKLAAVARTPTS